MVRICNCWPTNSTDNATTLFTFPAPTAYLDVVCKNVTFKSTPLCQKRGTTWSIYKQGKPTPLPICQMNSTADPQTLPNTNPWFSSILAFLPTNQSLNIFNLSGIICAPNGHTLTCGKIKRFWLSSLEVTHLEYERADLQHSLNLEWT